MTNTASPLSILAGVYDMLCYYVTPFHCTEVKCLIKTMGSFHMNTYIHSYLYLKDQTQSNPSNIPATLVNA